MAVKLRLARNILTRNSPSYTIVAIPSSLRVTAKPLEVLGTYKSLPVLKAPETCSPNGQLRGSEWGPKQFKKVGSVQEPGDKEVVWNEERIKWWLGEGAIPSKRVESLLVRAGIFSTNPLPPTTGRSISRLRRIREAVKEMRVNK